MRHPNMIMKQEFIKKWTIALNKCYKDSTKYMSFMEKQNSIKQTAAIAMASAKRGSTAWSRAILANEYKQKTSYTISNINRKLTRNKRPVRRAKSCTQVTRKAHKASTVAKSIIKKQTQVLKRLIPGGESIDECCLIGEALDYIVSLKAQVDVMKELVITAEYMKKP